MQPKQFDEVWQDSWEAVINRRVKCAILGYPIPNGNEMLEELGSRIWNAALDNAASMDPWESHNNRNPMAAVLDSPGQCVDVLKSLILSLKVDIPPTKPPTV